MVAAPLQRVGVQQPLMITCPFLSLTLSLAAALVHCACDHCYYHWSCCYNNFPIAVAPAASGATTTLPLMQLLLLLLLLLLVLPLPPLLLRPLRLLRL